MNGLPITRIETIADGTINPVKVGFADLEESECVDWLLQDGDILISHINSTKHLGKCAIYEGNPPALIHGMNLLVLRVDPNVAASRYVYWMLSSTGFRSKLPRITKDSVNQSSFNISSFKKLQIPLPPLAEQKRIAAILDAADALRAKRREALAQLDTLLQSTFLDMFGDPVTNPLGWEVRSLGDLAVKKPNNGVFRRNHEYSESLDSGLPRCVGSGTLPGQPYRRIRVPTPRSHSDRDREIWPSSWGPLVLQVIVETGRHCIQQRLLGRAGRSTF